MKLQLWIVNSFLVLLFLLALIVSQLLEQRTPVVNIVPVSFERKKMELKPVVATSWEKIYQGDVFGTYVKPVVEITKPSLVTPIPEPSPAQIITPPEPKLPLFVTPLNIVLKGIIVTGDEQKSAAMIADESNKERMYYLGDKIKDAQIIKIARNRIVVLRANGQQESFYIIKDDPFASSSADKWTNIIKKINDQQYKIDPNAFKVEVDSLGNFMERVGVLGTAYERGKPIGIKIGDVKDRDVATNLGLVQNDVITSINGIGVANVKERMRLYDAVSRMKVGDFVTVNMLRAGNEVSINYELAKFPRISRSLSAAAGQAPQKIGPDDLPMNPLQERETRMREFAKLHGGDQRDQRAVSDMRSRFLENLREKLKKARDKVRR